MTNFGIKISLSTTCFFKFLCIPQKMLDFHETVREHIELQDVHANIFFNILKFIFRLKGAYTPRIKTAFQLEIPLKIN
jgi:hypothetical protein